MGRKAIVKIPATFLPLVNDVLRIWNGKKVTVVDCGPDFVSIFRCDTHMTVPKNWIEEIPEGPISAEEKFDSVWANHPEFSGIYREHFERCGVEMFKAGESNDRKRTQPVIDAAIEVVKSNHARSAFSLLKLEEEIIKLNKVI